ncbi:MAG: hypothetical protein BRD48_02195 [Bacteroidetes bacterium QS_9_68_14]|nr:MAG: hypothetical protein BRD48_02195 [Bacteroidetes bacterium QS_9_68_14]
MKATRSASPLLAVFSALALLGTVALSGCSSSSLTGPEQAPPEIQSVEGGPAQSSSDSDNDEQNGGGTGTTASHNTMPEDD